MPNVQNLNKEMRHQRQTQKKRNRHQRHRHLRQWQRHQRPINNFKNNQIINILFFLRIDAAERIYVQQRQRHRRYI